MYEGFIRSSVVYLQFISSLRLCQKTREKKLTKPNQRFIWGRINKGFQDQLLLHHQPEMQHQNSTDAYFGVGGGGGGVGRSSLMFPSEVVSSPILPWTLPSPPPPAASLHHHNDHPFFLPPPPTPSSSSYGAFFNRRPGGGGGVGVGGGAGGLQFGYDHHHHQGPSSSSDHHHHHHLRLISDSIGQVVQSSSAPFGLQAELQKMTAQEIMDAKALAASKSHSEAERRRRERINNHLAKLRSLLPNTTKTDKASLLAEVIQHVKELKRQTSLIAESSTVPTEMDELTVDNASSDEDGKLLIKASLCCEDRSDLLPDLIKTLKALRLRTLKAEITTLAGRVKNVLFITTEDDDDNDNDTDTNVNGGGSDLQQQHYSIISSIQEALKAVMEKASGDDQSASGSVKRQRTNINIYP